MCMNTDTEQRIAIVDKDCEVRGLSGLVGKKGSTADLDELNHLLQHGWRVSFAVPHGKVGSLLVLEGESTHSH